jgi:pimeloyl-ACP methyl ester carboxylesterase
MPVPLRDDGSPGPTRRLVVFVHGFNSNKDSCWRKLLNVLEKDKSLSDVFDFDAFEYETALFQASHLKRLPNIDELGAELGSHLDRILVDRDSGRQKYIDATLVGHSMGGLVIQSYLVQRLNSGKGMEFDRLRQVILFATPNFGSGVLETIRRLLYGLFQNPQEEALRLFSEKLKHIHEAMRERIIDAQRRSDHTYPLPVYCFWGDCDDIVQEWSAKGHFPHGEPLRGHHNNLNQPEGTEDERYCAFVEALLHPHGHKHVWEIDTFRYSARVNPLRPGSVIVAKHGTKERLVETDNRAEVVRQLRFGRNNRCNDPFPLRYATRNDGWINPILPEHVTSAEKSRQYEDTGTEVIAEIAPERNQISRLYMEVYKGFDPGHRDYHMHLGRKAYFRRLEFEVDLSEYLAAGWRMTNGPHLYFHPHDPETHRFCLNRPMLDPDPPHEHDSKGIWRWTLEHVKEGVIDIVWDLVPRGVAVARESPSVIELGADEHAIFGYGSLLSLESLERTLGRSYTGPFVVCGLMGWYRTWSITMPNSTFSYQNGKGSWVTPERILYLDITPSPERRMNGVLFIVNKDDLQMFDDREWIYERVQINDQLRGVAVLNGPAWAFVGRAEHRLVAPASPRRAAVRRTYLDILEAGMNELGAEFAAGYRDSTEEVPPNLIVRDHKRDRPLSGAP